MYYLLLCVVLVLVERCLEQRPGVATALCCASASAGGTLPGTACTTALCCAGEQLLNTACTIVVCCARLHGLPVKVGLGRNCRHILTAHVVYVFFWI